jgi:H/ACA ribonucleoprotein complex subunit 4
MVSRVKRVLRAENIDTLERSTDVRLFALTVTRVSSSGNSWRGRNLYMIRLHDALDHVRLPQHAIETMLRGALSQRPPLISTIKRQLRSRAFYDCKLLKFECEAGTHVRTLCVHPGLLVGTGGHMQELRRVRSGVMGEDDNLVTALRVVCTARVRYHERRDLFAHIVLLTHFKRAYQRQALGRAVRFGVNMMIPGLLRISGGNENDEVVLIAIKEAYDLRHSHGRSPLWQRLSVSCDVDPRRWGHAQPFPSPRFVITVVRR